jgi:hypothetical protein
LDDCTEEVRYQAAIALCQAAGHPCKNCERNGCCNAAVMSKLEEIAHGQDETGCCKEASPRVRAAAENALNACRRKIPAGEPTPAAPKSKELPTNAVPNAPEPPSSPQPLVPAPASKDGAASWSKRGQSNDSVASAAGKRVLADVNSVSRTGFDEADDKSSQKIADAVAIVRCPASKHPGLGVRRHEASVCPEETSEPAGEATATPAEAAPGAAGEQSVPPSNALAGNFGAASGPMSAAPNMIGDLFGSGGVFVQMFDANETLNTARRAPLPGNTVPRFKMADNTSPLPQDRLYLDYSFYGDVPINDPGVDVNSFAPGFEKTFFDGRMSFEMRAPMANTLDHNIYFDNTTRTSVNELGDLGMAFKMLLVKNERFAVSGGLAMTVPTSPDERFFSNHDDADIDVLMKSESVHLMPFFGVLWTPNDRWFSLSYLQVDVDANGTPVSLDTSEATLTSIGRYREATFMYLDTALGYWVYRNDCGNRYLTGLAPVVEAHVNQSLERSQVLTSGSTQIGGDVNGNPINNVTIVDLMVGVHAEFCRKTSISAAYCVPATGDRQFEGEFRCFANRRF